MTDKIAAMKHAQKLNRDMLQAYDKLAAECNKIGDVEGADLWLRKAMDAMQEIERLDEEIHKIRIGRL